MAASTRLASSDRPANRISPQSRLARLDGLSRDTQSVAESGLGRTPVSWSGGDASEKEVIIIVRSKTDPRLTESITVSDPTPRLLNYLKTMSGVDQRRRVDVANLRELN